MLCLLWATDLKLFSCEIRIVLIATESFVMDRERERVKYVECTYIFARVCLHFILYLNKVVHDLASKKKRQRYVCDSFDLMRFSDE